MPTNQFNDKSIFEGYLTGGASLIVTILWIIYSPFHPLVIFALFLISLFCLSLSTLWLLSKEKTIKEWFRNQTSRYFIVGSLEFTMIVGFFWALFLLR